MPVTVSYTTTQGLFQALFQLLGKAVQSDLVRQLSPRRRRRLSRVRRGAPLAV